MRSLAHALAPVCAQVSLHVCQSARPAPAARANEGRTPAARVRRAFAASRRT
ncbi:hypothetical protein BMAPRL20_0710 [Burkholderia mallei PRL-20]|nr:hypothetical protein BMA10247_A1663 [Burkholderia mallei NCTC 10247]EES42956.1 hypothetical protein BMAPRL20_0710 [Burkholderia mallei PRL-20]